VNVVDFVEVVLLSQAVESWLPKHRPVVVGPLGLNKVVVVLPSKPTSQQVVVYTSGLSNYVQEPQTEVFATQAEPIEPFANEPQDHPQDCSG